MLKKQNGIGLLELMLSIIVITAVILGATKYYLVAREEMRIAQAEDIINTAVAAAYKWVEGSSDFKGLYTEVLVDAGLLPKKYMKNMDPWGGGMIQIFADTKLAPKFPWIAVRFGGGEPSDIPMEALKKLEAKYGGECLQDFRNNEDITSCVDIKGNHDFYFRAP